MPKATTGRRKGQLTASPFRFAHPFYTKTEPGARSPIPGIGAVRMLDFIEGHLESIPPVRGDSKLTLQDIVGADGATKIEAVGSLIFHSVGDTGKGSHTEQEAVANAMAGDYFPALAFE
jgi:hypothetical protein